MSEQVINLLQVEEVEIIYKQKISSSERPKITRSKEAYDLLLLSWNENKIDFVEQAKIILLNRSNRVLGISEISTGGISGTVVDPKIIFATALKANHLQLFSLIIIHPAT